MPFLDGVVRFCCNPTSVFWSPSLRPPAQKTTNIPRMADTSSGIAGILVPPLTTSTLGSRDSGVGGGGGGGGGSGAIVGIGLRLGSGY